MEDEVNNSSFQPFDIRQFAIDLSQKHDRSANIATKYLSRDSSFPVKDFENSVGLIFECIYNETNKHKAGKGTFLSPVIDDANTKKNIWQAAQTIAENKELQSRYIVNKTLVTVLDSELYPLKAELTNPDRQCMLLVKTGHRGFWGSMLHAVRSMNNITGVLVSLAIILFWVGYLFVCMFLINDGYYFLSILVSILPIVALRKWYYRRKYLACLSSCYTKYNFIREEIDGMAYNPVRIAERLKELEKEGTFVPSVAYSLLKSIEELPAD